MVGRTHAVVVDQHEPRAAHAEVLVAGLHQLAAGRVLRAGQAAGRELLGRAHVAEEQGAVRLRCPLLHGLRCHRRHIEALGQRLRGGAQVGVAAVGRIALRAAVFERVVVQVPTLRAVLQRIDGVRQPEVDERLRADDASRAARAVDDDGCGRVGHELPHAVGQFAVGAAGGAGDVHLVELADGAAVEHHDLVLAREHLGQLVGADAGRVVRLFGQFAEGLGGQVDAREEHVARGLPRGCAALQHMHIGVAQGGQAFGRAQGHIGFAIVVRDHPHAAARHEARCVDLEPAEGQRDAVEQMCLAVLAVLAHVEQRDLAAVVQPGFEGLRIDVRSHEASRWDERGPARRAPRMKEGEAKEEEA
jgi:hypothetical protein